MPRQGLKATPVGRQSGPHRFPKDSDIQQPQISRWRCNLTALSQFRNLYFVAFRDEIFVYEPQYPDQKVPSNPAGIIKVKKSRAQAVGYIDRLLPQGVNHLIVRELGNEEILLLACDGGDIIGYLVRDIEKSIQRSSGTSCLDLEPFFNENVGASGWGIDVHKSERLIAVSSNSHDIQIFAFALSKNKKGASKKGATSAQPSRPCFNDIENMHESLVSSRWKAKTSPKDCHRRHELDFAWTLRGHDANIPSVAFYNDEVSDPERVFLASTDIDGYTKLWSIWQDVSATFTFGGQMGWAVGCVNRATARIVASKTEAYGCKPIMHSQERDMSYVDISESVNHIPNNSRKCPKFKSSPNEPAAVANNSGIAEDNDTASGADEDEFSDEEDLMDVTVYEDEDDTSALLNDPLDFAHRAYDAVARLKQLFDADPTRLGAEEVRQIWPCNVFVSLTKDLLFTSVEPREHSMVWCKDAVCQEYEHPEHDPFILSKILDMRRFARLNMIHQIPELGLLIIGSQAGRVAILTMTYYAEKKRYGFKIEAVVPFKSQEDQNLRVHELLLGMAVSPVQGCSPKAYSPSSSSHDMASNKPEQQRRYRLLLYHYDHTTFSYEISQNEEGEILIF